MLVCVRGKLVGVVFHCVCPELKLHSSGLFSLEYLYPELSWPAYCLIYILVTKSLTRKKD